MLGKTVLEIKPARDSEETPEAAAQLFASLANILRSSFLDRLRGKEKTVSFEIAGINQRIRFFVVVPKELKGYLESLISAQYPKSKIEEVQDYLQSWPTDSILASGQLKLGNWNYLSIRTYQEFKETDPLTSVLGVFSKLKENERLAIQVIVTPAGGSWRRKGIAMLSAEEKLFDVKGVEDKLSQPGLSAKIRLLAGSSDVLGSKAILQNLIGSFGGFASGDGNFFVYKPPRSWQKKKFFKAIFAREGGFASRNQILNINELATIWHLPGNNLLLANIAWGKTHVGEAPENLPTALSPDKDQINFFAKTDYKNQTVNFGVKRNDRRRHLYVVGKTGTGKSTLIANMAIDDMRKKEGFAVIDPHGDLSETLLDFIPSFRVNDVVYLDPSNTERPFVLNPLEVHDPAQKELVSSAIVSVFHKLYGNSWGPRLEYILRNCVLTLLEMKDSTFLDILSLLADSNYRRRVVEKLDDEVLKNFWTLEFEKMPDKLRAESISPIQNKVGQFLSTKTIRNIVGHPKSTINLREILDSGKILLVNLSQGKLGEDNSALLGSMLITQIQLAAMGRINVPENDRKDFYLYVDEFQNFATTSFIKILSEARKYRLNLVVANQYLAQVDEEILNAILGNVGTIVSFAVGAEDAKVMSREFGEVYSEADMTALSNFQIVAKMSIDNLATRPFIAYTLPLPKSVTQNRQKVVRVSAERYGRKIEVQEVKPDLTGPAGN